MNHNPNNDHRLTSVIWRFRNFVLRNLGDKNYDRITDRNIIAELGYVIRNEKMMEYEELDRLRQKIKGNFEFTETLSNNYMRLLFGWSQAFMGIHTNLATASREMSRRFFRNLTGGALSNVSLIASTHYAASNNYNHTGFNFFSFWIQAQLFNLLLTPLNAVSTHLTSNNRFKNYSYKLAFSPLKILSDSILIFAFGLKNLEHPLGDLMFYPVVFLAGVAMQSSHLETICKFQPEKFGRDISNINFEKSNRVKALFSSNYYGIIMFTLFNSLLPVMLSQRHGSDKHEKLYFDSFRDPDFNLGDDEYE